MKLWVFQINDGTGGINYEYITNEIEANEMENILRRNDIHYNLTIYGKVYDFLSECEEVSSDSFTDGEALEYVLDVLNQLGV